MDSARGRLVGRSEKHLRDIEADKKCVLSLNMNSLISPWIKHQNW